MPRHGKQPAAKTIGKGSCFLTHYVLLKFAPGTDLDAVEQRVRKTYQELDETLPFLHEPRVFRSCVERDSNADIMAVIDLDGEEFLKPYLTHPLHLQMAGDLKDALIGRTSFDHK